MRIRQRAVAPGKSACARLPGIGPAWSTPQVLVPLRGIVGMHASAVWTLHQTIQPALGSPTPELIPRTAGRLPELGPAAEYSTECGAYRSYSRRERQTS